MNEILFQYHRPNPTTWVYISTLLSIGLFFKFNRFWSIRNLDLILVLLLAPGLVMANYGLAMRAAAEARLLAQQQADHGRVCHEPHEQDRAGDEKPNVAQPFDPLAFELIEFGRGNSGTGRLFFFLLASWL